MTNFPVKNLDTAVQVLRNGGAVAFPTDTFYALGVDAKNEHAIEKAFAIKRRRDSEPMPVLISSPDQARELVRSFPKDALTLANTFWPGPLTIVLDANDDVPLSLTAGRDTVGVRIPDNPVAIQLISKFGSGVTGTSANLSGHPPTKDATEVQNSLRDTIDLIIDAPCGSSSTPSTVIDMTNETPTVVRQGAIPHAHIAQAIGTVSLT